MITRGDKMGLKKLSVCLEKSLGAVTATVLLLSLVTILPISVSDPIGDPIDETIPPEINDVMDYPDPQTAGQTVNIECAVTDDGVVNLVKVVITFPDGVILNQTMARKTGTDEYYYLSAYFVVGVYSYFIWAIDDDGNANMSAIYGFSIQDITPPEVVAVYPNGGEIVRGSFNIRWTASDSVDQNLDGDISIDYSDDDGLSWQSLASSLDNDGQYLWDTSGFSDGFSYLINVTATDDYDNVGYDVSDAPFIIDNTDPQTDHDLDGTQGLMGWFISNVTVTLLFTDATAGVNYTMYRINNGTWQTYTQAFNIGSEGNHTLEYYSVDFAGNIEPINLTNIKIDKTGPSINITKPRVGYLYVFDRELIRLPLGNTVIIGAIMVTIEVENETSGVEKAEFYMDYELKNTDTIEPLEWQWTERSWLARNYLLRVKVFDVAGNSNIADILVRKWL
jgi:hypothetical protein